MSISEVTRRNILDSLLARDVPYFGRLDLIEFLGRTWDLSQMPSSNSRFEDAEGDIWQHMVKNNDWDAQYLLPRPLHQKPSRALDQSQRS